MRKSILLNLILVLSTVMLSAQHTSSINISGEPNYLATEEECYCHFYYDYTFYYDYIAAIAQAQRAAWFENQKNILKEEIEDRMNTTYSSFETAQYDFFKKRFAKPYADRLLSDTRRVDEVGKSNSYAEYSNTYVTRKIFQYAQNNAYYDFKGLTHYNKTIESMSFLEAQNLFNQYNTDNGDFENDWAYHHNRIIRNNWVNNNEQFHDFMTDEYVDHVNSFSLEQRVSLMTGYLIYNAQSQNLINPPPTMFNGVSLYLPYNYNYSNTINNFINNANVSWQGISSLNMSFEELLRRYSTMGMHLGTLTGNYLKNKETLRDQAGTYQGRENYSYTSRNMVKKLVEHYLNDEPFASDSYFDGIQTEGQDDDRPTYLMKVKLSTAAQNYGFRNFGGVLEAINDYTTDYAKEGKMIRAFFTENTTFPFVNTFSDYELGKIFDFDNRGTYYLGLQFSDYAMERIVEIEHDDNQYGWDLFTDSFKLKLLRELADGNYVTFDDKALMNEFFAVREEIPTAKFKRYLELIELSKRDPWVLLRNCTQQNGLNIANYQELYELQFPISCQNKLNSLGSGYSHQTISDGNAPLANIDYYAVEIIIYPDFNNDNSPDTEAQIYTAFRNNFINLASGEKENFQFTCNVPFNTSNTADIDWDFVPLNTNEGNLFTSNNPMTSVLLIEAGASGFLTNMTADEGAIIVSEFTPNDWTISTIETPQTGTQPFSGNRQWGWIINENGNLELYTRAVDVARISDLILNDPRGTMDCQQNDYYNVAEATWENMQQELYQWINSNGGQAIIKNKVAKRVDKQKLKQILESNNSIDEIICN